MMCPADTAGQKGYNIARKQSPQQATWQSPTSAGDDKLLYGQGRPMAKSASGDGADFADGLTSENTGATVTVESRLFFDGTVASSSSANDLSRATDAREKGRIGIFGSALAYAGSYGRVTSESIGRDLNPLGRGDGGAYVAGGMNLGRITPALPWNNSPGGWGNSVNNGCGDSSGNSIGGPSGIGGDVSTTTCSDPSECKDAGIPPCCCCPWPCKNSPETGNIVGPAVRECSCPVECSRDGIRCTGELEPNWTNWCEGQFGTGSGNGSSGGCPGCGGTTGPWGPQDNGGGGGIPGFPPGWGIPGGGVTGPWRPLGNPGGGLPGDFPPGLLDPPNYSPPPSPQLPYPIEQTRFQDPRLKGLLSKLLSCLENVDGDSAECARAALRTKSYRLKVSTRWDKKGNRRGWQGYTNPFTDTIYIDYHHWQEESECEIMSTILHETMHQCGVFGREIVLPLYYWGFVDWHWIYGKEDGISNNAAQREADKLMEHCCCDPKKHYGLDWSSQLDVNNG